MIFPISNFVFRFKPLVGEFMSRISSFSSMSPIAKGQYVPVEYGKYETLNGIFSLSLAYIAFIRPRHCAVAPPVSFTWMNKGLGNELTDLQILLRFRISVVTPVAPEIN